MKVNEIFQSVQGEGILQGLPTVFVRLAGCNLECAWCDTVYARDPENGDELDLDQVYERVRSFKCREVCITGGEPLIQSTTPALVEGLVQDDHRVMVETNGTMPLDDLLKLDEKKAIISMDIKCPSSGMFSKNRYENIQMLRPGDQLKLVIEDHKDFEFAKKIVMEHKPCCHVIFQPVWGDDMAWIAERVVKEDLGKYGVRVMVQLHKVFWGDLSGV